MFKQVLWIFVPLGIFFGTMSVVSVLVNGLDIELATAPEKILSSYLGLRDRFFSWFIEWWWPWSIPIWVKDAAAIWAFCSATLYNYYRMLGVAKEYGPIPIILAPYIFAITAYEVFFEFKTIEIQYIIFYILHVFILALCAFLTALFLWWNHSAVQAMAPV